jgi:hypothetical protein
MTTSLPRSLARLALPALAAAVLAPPLAGQRTERFAVGASAAVHNLAGEVTVVPGTGSAVVVEVTRGGEDAARLRVNHEGGEVRVVYPGDRVVYPRMGPRARSTLEVRRNGTLGGGLLGARRVTVAGAGTGTRAWADVRVLVPAGRTVSVHQGVGRVQVANVNGRIDVKAVSAPVRTQGTRGSLNVRVGAGAVEVRDAQGDVIVGTGSGAVTLANVRGDLLDVGTGSGGVTGSGLRVQTVDVGVGSGAVSLTGVQARDVTVETGNGAVTLGLAGDADLDIDTGNGGVTVTVPPAFGAQLEIETGGGAIRVDLPMSNRRTGRHTLTGRVGNGSGSAEISTGAGAVSIRRS